MLHFTNNQISEIIEILQNAHWMFIGCYINPDVVPKRVMKDLVKMGFSVKQVVKYPELAYSFGLLSVYMKDSDVKRMGFYQLKQSLKAGKLLPLSEAEKVAVRIVEQRAVEGITGLGNKIASNLRTIFIEKDLKQRKEFEEIIREASKKAIKKRETIKGIVSEIGHKTNDWARDLDRIADFILHEAYDNGRAFAIKKSHGNNAVVYKRVHKDACEHCKRLYLEDEITWEPRLFKLSELMGNGTNIGVKVKDWKPVIGATHPWCNCDLEYVPFGYVWDKKTKSFRFDNGLSKDPYKLKKKIKVNIEKIERK